MNVSSGQERIVKTIINGLLPVSGQAACADQIFQTIAGFMSGRCNQAIACAEIANVLQAAGIPVDSRRTELCVETAFSLACGYGYWLAGQKPIILRAFPAWELVKLHAGTEPLNWVEAWQRHGGWPTPSGRMFALKDDPVWQALSAFGLPFPPFDLGSGMYWREVSRDEAIEVGLIVEDENPGEQKAALNEATKLRKDVLDPDLLREINAELAAEGFLEKRAAIANSTGGEQSALAEIESARKIRQFETPPPRRSVNIAPVSLDFAEAFERRVASYFGEEGRRQRLDVASSGASASELLSMAEQRMVTVRGRGGTGPSEIISLLMRALERGFGENVQEQMRASGLLVDAFDLIAEPEKAAAYRSKHLEFLKAWIQKGIPIESNQLSVAYGQMAKIYEALGQADQAATYRQLQLENRDGFTLLHDAREKLKSLGKRIDEENGAEILEMLTKAAERIPQDYPERHAEIYHATGEILEAWGDTAQALEYYRYALQKNPKADVKR